MGRHHQSKKSNAEKGKKPPGNKYDLAKSGRRKLPDDFLYTQNHKSIWNSFCNFLDERFAEEDLSEILDTDEIARIKTPPIIPAMIEFVPENPGDVESDEARRARARGQALADKSYASRESNYLEGIKKLAAKFNRATVLVLKHVDALINLDMHQFLKSDPIKRLDPESKYNSLRQHFSDHWGPHSSLDVAKIKQELTEMEGDDPGWRKYLQNFNYFVGSLEQTMQRDATDAIIYGPLPNAEYPPRPLTTAPAAQHTAYVIACQQADEARDALYPHGGPPLNHRPTDIELKTILLEALSASKLSAYKTLYQQYCNRSHNGKTYTDLYNDIHDLVKYESDGVRSSTRDRENDADDSDASRSTRASSRSSNLHSSRRAAQIAAAAQQRAQQVAANTSANSNILYQQQSPVGSNKGSTQRQQEPCKNCKSTKHSTKWCTSTKCYEKDCGKTFDTADDRKAHFIKEHGYANKSGPPKIKSALKDGGKGHKVKFSKNHRAEANVNRVQRSKRDSSGYESADSEVSSDSSMSVERPPKSIVWKGTAQRNSGRKVSNLRSVTIASLATSDKAPQQEINNDLPTRPRLNSDEPPPLIAASDESDTEAETGAVPIVVPQTIVTMSNTRQPETINVYPENGITERERRLIERERRNRTYASTHNNGSRSNPVTSNSEPVEAKHDPQPRQVVNLNEQPKADEPTMEHSRQVAVQEGNKWINESDIEDTRPRGPRTIVRTLSDLVYEYNSSDPDEDRNLTRIKQDKYARNSIHPFRRYKWYRKEGGRMKFFPTDTGEEDYYHRWQPAIFEDGLWMKDYKYIRPSIFSFRDRSYRQWYQSTYPLPANMHEAVQQWEHNRQFINDHAGSDITMEQYVDDYLVRPTAWVNNNPIEPTTVQCDQSGDTSGEVTYSQPILIASRQTRNTQQAVEEAVKNLQRTDSRLRQEPYKGGNKPNIRTQTATTLSERIRQVKRGILAHNQRNVNAIVDTGAQVTTMPESAVSRMPYAHNHRDAPPGTAVRYGNGELEIIERLVDIGHFEVQVTPDNCTSTLISVDQIVKDGHTVTFSETHTIIEDNNNRYRLAYPRVAESREWTVPMTAMEDITKLRKEHPYTPHSA